MVSIAHLTTVESTLDFMLMPQLEAVVARGDEAIGISAPADSPSVLPERGIRHIPLGSSTRGMDPLADLRAAWQLWSILRREKIDVLHTHNPKPGLYGRVVGRLAGVPVVVNTVHGLYATEDDKFLRRAVIYGLEAVAARFSDHELYQNIEDLELVRQLRIVPRDRASLLGNGINLDRFDPSRYSPADRMAIREELGIDPNKIVVGTVGRLVFEKGYEEIIAAAEQLDDRFAVIAIGPHDAEKADELTAADIERGEAAGVHFLGHRRDMERCFAAMDIMVLASYREGLPRAAIEATAMGLPVIATDIRGCRQVVDHGETGLLIPCREVPALVDAILELGDDDERRLKMGEAGRERALQLFDERDVVERVFDAYRTAERHRNRGRLGRPHSRKTQTELRA